MPYNSLPILCWFPGSIHDQPKESIRERKLYEKLKALNKYHKRNGHEAILYKKFVEKRQRSRDGVQQSNPPKPSFHMRCIFTEGGVKCGERIVPCTKYCRKHILEDKKQVLFSFCGIEKSGVVCQEPVANIFEDASCLLHIQLPLQKNYTQKKYESESEEEIEVKDVLETKIKIEENEQASSNDLCEQVESMSQSDERVSLSTEENFTIAHEQLVEQANAGAINASNIAESAETLPEEATKPMETE